MWSGQALMVSYAVEPAASLILPNHEFRRIDRLWEHSCFELFVKPLGGDAYEEFNFAPALGWNAYSFSKWREGMASLPLPRPPHMVDCRLDDRADRFPDRYELDVVFHPCTLPNGHAEISPTAILEETDGRRSYWAMAHPPGEPNFHHGDCFQLRLPAPAEP
jgi:hypothetical protein